MNKLATASAEDIERLTRVGPRKWHIDELQEHDKYCEKFYNLGAIKIPEEIRKGISSIDFSKVKYGSNDIVNVSLAALLKPIGWRSGDDIGRFKRIAPDFAKDGVVIEAQFRQNTNIVYNLLSIQSAFSRKKIDAGIIITFDGRTHEVKSSMDASIQYVDLLLHEFEDAVRFSVPLWVIGLKEV